MLQNDSAMVRYGYRSKETYLEAVNPLSSLAALTANIEHSVRHAFMHEHRFGNAGCFPSHPEDLYSEEGELDQSAQDPLVRGPRTNVVKRRPIARLEESREIIIEAGNDAKL